jgi:hypothetical protein
VVGIPGHFCFNHIQLSVSFKGIEMPTISLFYGIVIYMYAFDNRKHHKPHIHAEYSGDTVVVDIENGDILEGSVPAKKMKLIQAWIIIHKEDLIADWNIAIEGGEIFKIDPLR